MARPRGQASRDGTAEVRSIDTGRTGPRRNARLFLPWRHAGGLDFSP